MREHHDRDPDPSLTDERFGKNYFQQVPGLDQLRLFGINWWSVRFYALIIRRLLRRNGGRRVLDVGCAHGYVLSRLEREFETWGFDISQYAIGRARQVAPGSRVFVADVLGEALPEGIADGGFDLVLAKYVLEHLPEPERGLERMASLLAPGGHLIFSVPEMRSPSRRVRGEAWYGYQDVTHISMLEASEWLALTERVGLKVERTFADGIWDLPWIPWLPKVIQYPLFCMPTIVSVFFAQPMIPAGWGENLIVIAQKDGRKVV